LLNTVYINDKNRFHSNYIDFGRCLYYSEIRAKKNIKPQPFKT